MRNPGSYRELLYQYEILHTRLEIREHFLKTVVKDVYENIGQVLSLIRVQLSLLRSDFETGKKEKIDSSGELVGRTIRDLRNMCQLFYPEADIISGAGFNRVVEHEIKTIYPEAECHIDEESMILETIQEEKGLVLFGILLKILTLIREDLNGQLNSAVVKYMRNKICITIDYGGETIKRNKKDTRVNPFDLSIFERAELMGGYLQIKNAGHACRRIKLVIPIN